MKVLHSFLETLGLFLGQAFTRTPRNLVRLGPMRHHGFSHDIRARTRYRPGFGAFSGEQFGHQLDAAAFHALDEVRAQIVAVLLQETSRVINHLSIHIFIT
jgi:hypothetical protein